MPWPGCKGVKYTHIDLRSFKNKIVDVKAQLSSKCDEQYFEKAADDSHKNQGDGTAAGTH